MPTRLEEFHTQHRLRYVEFKEDQSTKLMHEFRLAGLKLQRYTLRVHAADRDLGFLFECPNGLRGIMWATMATKTVKFHIWLPGCKSHRTARSSIESAVRAINGAQIIDMAHNEQQTKGYVTDPNILDWRQF